MSHNVNNIDIYHVVWLSLYWRFFGYQFKELAVSTLTASPRSVEVLFTNTLMTADPIFKRLRVICVGEVIS